LLISLIFVSGILPGLLAKPRPQIPVTPDVLEKITSAIPQNLEIKPESKKKILLFSKCGGFVHNSIDVGKALFENIQKQYPNLEFTFDDDIESFTAEKLKSFDAVMNLNATHVSKTFQDAQKKALLDFISGGKVFIGIHAASDAGNWPEYTKMIGGNFNGHPWTAGGTWDFKVEAEGHFTCSCLKSKFKHKDEIYRHKDVPEGLQYLVTLDSNSFTNALWGHKKEPSYIFKTTYGVSWLKQYGKGKIFYSNFGHNADTYWNKEIVEHYLRGIIFVLGK
jgi:type 1 glutamine amidotransferase